MGDAVKLLSEALDIEGTAEWAGEDFDEAVSRMPLAARSAFVLEGVSLLGERMMCARPLDEMRPAALIAQLGLMEASARIPVVCVLDKITPYLRRTMLNSRVAFASADGQVYVPGLLRLKAQRMAAPRPKRTSMTPSAKLAFTYLACHAGEDVTVADLVAATGMSRPTGKRVLEEVRVAAPLARRMGGPKMRTAIYRVDDPQGFAEEGGAAFGEAVSERFFVSPPDASELPLSGLSALAERSMLAPPRTPQVACSTSAAAALRGLAVEPGAPGSAVEVQVLSYDPKPLVEAGLVDLCTMVLTVDRADERVEGALEEALEEKPWLMSMR